MSSVSIWTADYP